jgi:DNA-nicking Smr family endonuclease
MKSTQNGSFHRPFSQLKGLIDENHLNLAPPPAESGSHSPVPLTLHEEDELFVRAVNDVTPLKHNRHWHLSRTHRSFPSVLNRDDEEGTAALQELIRTGRGFVVAQTDEYMEACGPGVSPGVTCRLHQGRYSIQDHIDLHGLFVREARGLLHRFIRRSIQRGYGGVLIVHGRGLKSPGKPVLKAKVFQWLTRGPLRAHVIALASARACDGGAGATYVLLRSRPMGKRQRRVRSGVPAR